MLSSMQLCSQPQARLEIDSRYNRDEKDDLKKALDYLWDFRAKLAELHPNVVGTIETLLQRPRY